MAKKGLFKLAALAAIAGAAAAGVSYFIKYREFHRELEKDFHDFEDENLDSEQEPAEQVQDRSYVSLHPDKGAASDSEAQSEENTVPEPDRHSIDSQKPETAHAKSGDTENGNAQPPQDKTAEKKEAVQTAVIEEDTQ